jgi:cob(I)alamin adenosyltransferase
MRIYTRTGDSGETGLFNGKRVAKNDLRVAAYGDVDELNAAVGLARSFISDSAIAKTLIEVQKDLFSLGAYLADPDFAEKKHGPKSHISEIRVADLEKWIDQWETELTPLQHFILPGGSQAGACLHLARTVCRRAERQVVSLSQQEKLARLPLTYLNRLSDFLFVLARYLNHQSKSLEILW